MSNFIAQFPLRTEIYQEDILNKRFEIGRHLYNSVLGLALKRYKEMYKTSEERTGQIYWQAIIWNSAENS